MHPVGPLNPNVYWVRRVLIVVLAVSVLIGVVWFLASRSSRTSAGQEPSQAAVTGPVVPTLTGVLAASTAVTTSGSSGASGSPVASGASASGASASGSPASAVSGTATAGSPATTSAADGKTGATPSPTAASALAAAGAPPSSTATSAPKPSAGAAAKPAAKPSASAAPQPPAPKPPAPKPSYAPDGALLCPDAALVIAAISTAPTFTVGSQPMLGMTVTNSGAVPCRRDVSGTLQTFTVQTAAGKRVWSTADCFPGEGTEVRDLAPGQTVQYTVKWSGRTSAPGCTGDRAPVPAGKYVVMAQLGKLSGKPAAFSITG